MFAILRQVFTKLQVRRALVLLGAKFPAPWARPQAQHSDAQEEAASSRPADGCDPYALGHTCEDGKPYVEEEDNSAAMSYKGGYDAGFAAGQAWGKSVQSLN